MTKDAICLFAGFVLLAVMKFDLGTLHSRDGAALQRRTDACPVGGAGCRRMASCPLPACCTTG